MLGKLLKYDLKAAFKYWWILAVTSLAFACLGGMCINTLRTGYSDYSIVYVFAMVGVLVSIIGLFLLPIMSIVIVLVRLYKNFYTDEAYLTFTLPVKKSELVNSKILMALILSVLTTIVGIIDIFVLLMVALREKFFDPRVWNAILYPIRSLFEQLGVGFSITYIVELALIAIAMLLLSILILFICMTIASLITRKHKVLVAVALYYVINTVLSVILEICLFEGSITNLIAKIATLDSLLQIKMGMAIVLLVALAMSTVVVTGVYILQNWLIDKKLNIE